MLETYQNQNGQVIRGEKGGGAEVPVSGLYKKGLGMSGELQKNTKIKKSKINKDNASEMMESLLGNLNMNNKFQYMEMNTEVEMSAQEFTEIMDHMNSKEQYKNLSQEEKMYKIMETANYVGTGGLLDIQC